MLNGDGLTLARAVRKLYPSVPILLMSGHYWPDTGFDFLEKPFTSVGLTVFIRKLTAPTAARLAWADTVRAGQ
jgi:FixJ family two-component response regulator